MGHGSPETLQVAAETALRHAGWWDGGRTMLTGRGRMRSCGMRQLPAGRPHSQLRRLATGPAPTLGCGQVHIPGRYPASGDTDRADAQALGEAVVSCDVLIQPLDCPLPQAGAMVPLVQVEDGCGDEGISGHRAGRGAPGLSPDQAEFPSSLPSFCPPGPAVPHSVCSPPPTPGGRPPHSCKRGPRHSGAPSRHGEHDCAISEGRFRREMGPGVPACSPPGKGCHSKALSRNRRPSSFPGRGQGRPAAMEAHHWPRRHVTQTTGEDTGHHLRGQLTRGDTHRTLHGAASCVACTGRRGPRCPSAPASLCWRSLPRRAPGDAASAQGCQTPSLHPTHPVLLPGLGDWAGTRPTWHELHWAVT